MNTKPIITISIFGGSGSGKTTYFTALYKVLKDYSSHNFKINSTFETNKMLNGYWSQINNINDDWPKGTRKMDDFEFNCSVKMENEEYETCKFRYVDYSGGIFSDFTHENKPLVKRMEETDIAFILLDSYKIVKFINNTNSVESEVRNWMNELDSMFYLIENAKKKDIPVHFILTKWDYIQSLDSNKFNNLMSLKNEIKNMHPDINSITIFIKNKTNIRLIPVSVVGQGFTEYEEGKDGTVTTKKRSGKTPEPYNIVVPIAYALIDIVKFTNERYEKEIEHNNTIVRTVIMLKRYFNAFVGAKFSSDWTTILIQVVINTFINKFPETNVKFNSNKKYKKALTTNYNIFKEIIEQFESANGTMFK